MAGSAPGTPGDAAAGLRAPPEHGVPVNLCARGLRLDAFDDPTAVRGAAVRTPVAGGPDLYRAVLAVAEPGDSDAELTGAKREFCRAPCTCRANEP